MSTVTVALQASTIRERLRRLAGEATPGPWFWNSYNAVFSAPLTDEYNRLEALIPKDAPDDDPRWDVLPETVVAGGPRSGHGDLPTAAGAHDLPFIAAASPGENHEEGNEPATPEETE